MPVRPHGAETLVAQLRGSASLPRDVPALRCSLRANVSVEHITHLDPLGQRCLGGGGPQRALRAGRTRTQASRGLAAASSHLVLFLYFTTVV